MHKHSSTLWTQNLPRTSKQILTECHKTKMSGHNDQKRDWVRGKNTLIPLKNNITTWQNKNTMNLLNPLSSYVIFP